VVHDLIGALQDAVHAAVADEPLDLVVAQVAVAAVQLQGLVAHLVGVGVVVVVGGGGGGGGGV
jgi:hypothetical protein